MDGDADGYSCLCTAEYILSNFFLDSEASNLNPPSKISFPATFPYPVNETSRIFITEYPSGLPFIPNPTNALPHMWSPESPPCSHTTSQTKNGSNYHFRFGLISAADPLDPHYEPPPPSVSIKSTEFDNGRTPYFP